MDDLCEVIKRIKNSVAIVAVLDSKNNILGTGSGFVFIKMGILVTCNHVVKSANSVFIKFPNSEWIGAKIILRDEEHDLALLKFEDNVRSPLPDASAKSIIEGERVIFSGYPLNLSELTTHQGIVSAITEDVTGIKNYLIDGTVNSGNSGCPLMNLCGEVIGIVNAKRRERSDLLEKVEKMQAGAVSLHGLDLVEIYRAIINNVQLGIGYAVPACYIPEYKEFPKDEKK
ncbi:MAG: hypothetical protein COV46_01345 [Deltaproteobacteria bacterium CG11_big_fil_rev_8_21_14_0_20_49_13]|nr:MAG: hypothetical protein COV46_01345 [Deltaproteobacteria bacterium CG11_big_fil_rev_8_21_14_0_20_49_13]